MFGRVSTINTSDIREKTAIENSDLGLSFINKLRPVSYKFIVGENKPVVDEDGKPVFDENGKAMVTPVPGIRHHYGLISQEVKEAVDESTTKDFAGWTMGDKDDPNSLQGLRYGEFIAPLVKAVQELTARIEELEARP